MYTLNVDDSITDARQISQAFSVYFLSIAEQINKATMTNSVKDINIPMSFLLLTFNIPFLKIKINYTTNTEMGKKLIPPKSQIPIVMMKFPPKC